MSSNHNFELYTEPIERLLEKQRGSSLEEGALPTLPGRLSDTPSSRIRALSEHENHPTPPQRGDDFLPPSDPLFLTDDAHTLPSPQSASDITAKVSQQVLSTVIEDPRPGKPSYYLQKAFKSTAGMSQVSSSSSQKHKASNAHTRAKVNGGPCILYPDNLETGTHTQHLGPHKLSSDNLELEQLIYPEDLHGKLSYSSPRLSVTSSFFTHNVPKKSSVHSQLRLLGRSKLRKHVVIEISHGTHKIHEWQAAQLLHKVHTHNSADYSAAEFRGGILTYRDCRQVFTDVHQVPGLEVRRHCIVVCLPPVTCFVLHDCVLLLVVEELKADGLIEQLTRLTDLFLRHASLVDVNAKRETSINPFEFFALECIISAAFEQLNADILFLEDQFDEIESRVKVRKLQSLEIMEDLHNLKQPIGLYEDRVRAFDKAFNELIADPEGLKHMELTKYYRNPALYEADRKNEYPNPDLQILLEYFDQELDQFNERVKRLKEQIVDKERFIALRLALMRSRLIKYDLAASSAAGLISLAACITGCSLMLDSPSVVQPTE